LVALLPGNISNGIYYSHQGLTYGGLIPTAKITTLDTLLIFNELVNILKEKSIKEIIYKPTPHIYHNYPSEEEIYALFKLGAKKIGCQISSAIAQNNRISFIESRKSGVRKAKNEAVIVNQDHNIAEFWKVLADNLDSKHGQKPVHSLDEITDLMEKFPEKMKIYTAKKDNITIAGTLILIMGNIVHVQYISANEEGKKYGALDLVFHYLINDEYKNIKFFDFGHSTENMGSILNERLIFQKEGFGARGIVYETYKLQITDEF
jgi:hypothetical protein